MKNKIKQLRVRIDGLAQLVKELEIKVIKKCEDGIDIEITVPYKFKPRTLHNAEDSLILAKAWLGKVLQELGEETPYKNDGKRKNVEDIEETADTNYAPELLADVPYGKGNHVEKVDWLREQIKNLIIKVDPYNKNNTELILENTAFLGASLFNCHRHLIEARFWLGFELGRIRDEQNK